MRLTVAGVRPTGGWLERLTAEDVLIYACQIRLASGRGITVCSAVKRANGAVDRLPVPYRDVVMALHAELDRSGARHRDGAGSRTLASPD